MQQKKRNKKATCRTQSPLNTAQTTQSTNRSEQNKEQEVSNIATTKMGKARTTGCREQERAITDQLCYDMDQRNLKCENVTRRITFVTNSER